MAGEASNGVVMVQIGHERARSMTTDGRRQEKTNGNLQK